MTFDKQAAAARFEARTYESGCGTIRIRKPKAGAYAAYLDAVRKCADAQKKAGDGAAFDPDGVTDLMLVKIGAVDEAGAPLFADVAEVESLLSASEILDLATMTSEMIRPTANPTTAPAPACS